MQRFRVSRLAAPVVAAFVGLLLASCGESGVGVVECPVAPGEVVITEILVDPEGANEGAQWIEIFNASGRDLDLRGVSLVLGDKRTTIRGDAPVVLFPGTYGVLTSGSAVPDALWSYGDRLGTMTKGGGTVSLRCGDGTSVASICYGEACGEGFVTPSEGKSWALTGGITPTAEAAEDLENWAAAEPSPGAANPEGTTCPRPPEGTTAVPPAAGDLSITELFPAPDEGGSDNEWLEIHVTAEGWLDLTGLRLVKGTDPEGPGLTVVRAGGCLLVEPGGYYVFGGASAATTPPAEEGGAPTVDGAPLFQTWGGSMGLVNSDGVVSVFYEGELIADAAWESSTKAHALQRTEDGGWCTARRPFDDWQRFGSPGAANPACDACFCVASDGSTVEAVSPAVGEIVVSEVMANAPGAESDNAGLEWFELHVPSSVDGDRDLACLYVSKAKDDFNSAKPIEIAAQGCLRASPGDWLLFARSDDPSLNGGLTPDGVYTNLSFNADGGVALYAADGSVLDTSDYGEAADGVARQVGYEHIEDGEADLANDEPSGWSDALPIYNPELGEMGAMGTPGGPNHYGDRCMCVNDDGEVQQATPPGPGELIITEIFGDTPVGEEPEQEWFEVIATVPGRYLNCVQISQGEDALGDPFATLQTGCLPVDTESPTVLCHDLATAATTGIPDCVQYDPAASNGLRDDGTLALVSEEGTIVEVEYGPLDPQGVSLALCADRLFSGPQSIDDWLYTDVSYVYHEDESTGDQWIGTPGSFVGHPDCPL